MADEIMHELPVRLSADQFANLTRFQEARGVASQDAAIRLLLDIAFEAVSGSGRRYWDTKVIGDDGLAAEPDGQPALHARALAERLRDEGHGAAAERLHKAAGDGVGHALLAALREACQTVLTTIEAIDPKTQLMAEELRLEIDKRLPP